MRFTLSAKSLSEFAGRDFSYVWPITESFRPALTDLWMFDEHSEMSWSDSVELARTHPFVDHSYDFLGSEASDSEVWHVRSGSALNLRPPASPWAQGLRDLDPVPWITKRVRDIHKGNFDSHPYVGVMIRAHVLSHAKTLEASPVSWYLDRMKEIQANQPDVRFFLSCDVVKAQEEVLRAFPDAVAQSDKGVYNSAEGVKSSVVDLYLLGSANHMLVPYWSSFPDLAWELSDRKISKETSRTMPVDAKLDFSSTALDPLKPFLRTAL